MAAMKGILASSMTPGPLGMCETKPIAEAPNEIAKAASSTFLMQQIFTLGLRIALIGWSLAVGNPNVFHLGCMTEEPTPFALFHIEPVNRAAFVGEYLFQVPD